MDLQKSPSKYTDVSICTLIQDCMSGESIFGAFQYGLPCVIYNLMIADVSPYIWNRQPEFCFSHMHTDT